MNENLTELLDSIQSSLISIKEKKDYHSKEITKYFDRINDKLFSVNNFLIAGYLALIAFKTQTPKIIIFAPLINCAILIYVDWRMMENNRVLSDPNDFDEANISKANRKLGNTNLLSLLTIVTSTITVSIFAAYVYWMIK
jgi:hypothetical protein